MNTKAFITSLAWVALVGTAYAQSNDITTIIHTAQERSSLVQAARATVEARRATLSGARSIASPFLELSPGVGYTNGNSVLSQEIDLFGRRRAATRLAEAQLQFAEIGVAKAQADVAHSLLNSVARVLAATEEVESARAALESANALLAAVTKRHEIGEAPKVHVTRAGLDALRATQMVTQAEGRLRAAEASGGSLIGSEQDLRAVEWPRGVGSAPKGRSFELLEANVSVAMGEAHRDVVRSEYAPSFSAGVATDVWSLNRNAFRRENFGLQVSLRMQLFDAGKRRSATNASRSEISAARARVVEAQRVADLALAEAETAYKTAQMIAASYEGDVLPKGEAMLTAMREGYASGLVTLVEVLEAHQTLVKLRQERIQAVLQLRLAEVELWRSQLTLPGTAVNS